MSVIPPIGPASASLASAAVAPGTKPGQGFGAVLRQAIERVNEMQYQGGAEVQRLLTGDSQDMHKSMMSVQRSELAFEMLLAVRNKVVEAYQEIMRIQV
ncbi:MAG TPA: flagellar hook-basal body complex protein FliE [Bryobacterales bacterium]|nr:flagellar hook-basal body complex protein FliE [Bryobacterales bacterium]